jgi:hypothetical protein
MITDLGHPAFAAHDVDATLSFYKILAIEEAFRLHHDGSLMLVYLHVSGDRFIEIFPGGPPPDPRTELRAHLPANRRHLCGRRTSARERRARRSRAPPRPRRQPPGLDARPRRKPDRTNATLRAVTTMANRPRFRKRLCVGINPQIFASADTVARNLLPAGQVNADEYHHAAGYLVCAERLAEEHDP